MRGMAKRIWLYLCLGLAALIPRGKSMDGPVYTISSGAFTVSAATEAQFKDRYKHEGHGEHSRSIRTTSTEY